MNAAAPDRRGTWSEKWDHYAGRDVLPMWVADMDFPAPPCVLDAIRERLEHGVLGYTRCPPAFGEALAGWLQRRHAWTIDPVHVVPVPGMVVAMNLATRLLSRPGEESLVLTPIYPPFLGAPGHAGGRCVRVPLSPLSGRWEVDWDALAAAATPLTRILSLCSPHNPTGRVWTRAEQERLAAFAVERNLHIISDEAWMDLVLEPGARHVPMASLSPEIAARTVTILAPSKTFNIPGLSCAAMVIPDPELRKAVRSSDLGLMPWNNGLGLVGAIAAWTHGDAWLDALLADLRANRDAVHAVVNALPGLSSILPESTYLTWIDCRQRGLADPAAAFEAAGVGLSNGAAFGAPGFVRLNFACQRTTLDEGLRRLARA